MNDVPSLGRDRQHEKTGVIDIFAQYAADLDSSDPVVAEMNAPLQGSGSPKFQIGPLIISVEGLKEEGYKHPRAYGQGLLPERVYGEWFLRRFLLRSLLSKDLSGGPTQKQKSTKQYKYRLLKQIALLSYLGYLRA